MHENSSHGGGCFREVGCVGSQLQRVVVEGCRMGCVEDKKSLDIVHFGDLGSICGKGLGGQGEERWRAQTRAQGHCVNLGGEV